MNNSSDKDQVFAKPLTDVKAFEFNESVTRVFRDMISRSVPGYDLLLNLIGLYADVFSQQDSSVYDLGCSLGEVSHIIAEQVKGKNCTILAIDNSPSMINKCIDNKLFNPDIKWLCEDIESVDIENASIVVLNLTMQFVAPHYRDNLINKIHRGLRPGGVLILTEKVLIDDEAENSRMVQLYQAFKKTQGYSDLEISQKRIALEDVLIPDSESALKRRLEIADFNEIYSCFRCFNFVSYLAIK